MKVKKGDKVTVLSGKDRGKTGKVVKSLPKESRVIVEGVNLRRRRERAKKQGQKGQTVEVPFPIAASNVALVCPKCGKRTRVGARVVGEKKLRICKKCQAEI